MKALQARRGGFVQLAANEVGILDRHDLGVLESLAVLGKVTDDSIKIPTSRVFLLDSMLQTREAEGIEVDKKFATMRKRANVTVKPRNEPTSFRAELRPYQREGLGWFQFLRTLGVGGLPRRRHGTGQDRASPRPARTRTPPPPPTRRHPRRRAAAL